MQIHVINKSIYPLPSYATAYSAGLDLRANIPEAITIQPCRRQLIPTGISMAIPVGYEGQVRSRSGLALKYGIHVLNSPGTIDSDYRGEIGVILMNSSDVAFDIAPGDKIAQLVISKYEQVALIEVDILEDTMRGIGGYGSTGI